MYIMNVSDICHQVLTAFASAFRALSRQLAACWARRQASAEALAGAPQALAPLLRTALALQLGRSYLRRLPQNLQGLEAMSSQLRRLAPEERSFEKAAECLKSRSGEGVGVGGPWFSWGEALKWLLSGS